MFLPCYPLFLVECKSNHPFLGTTVTELYQSPGKGRKTFSGWQNQGIISTQHHATTCQVICLLAQVNGIPQEMCGHLRSDLS